MRDIIEPHGGTIWPEALPDRGATFFFTLQPFPEDGSMIGVA